MQCVLKLSFRGETHRLTLDQHEVTFKELEARVNDLYEEARRPKSWTLIYRDNEDDLVTVSNDEELKEACHVFAELKESTQRQSNKLHLHFHVVAKVTLKEQLAPVIHAVEEISGKVVRLAADTRESIRRSSYVEKGRESLATSAVHTREALSAAGRGISHRIRRASSAASEQISGIRERVERRRSRFSSQDMVDVDDSSPVALMATDVERNIEDDVVPDLMPVEELLAQARAAEQAESEDEATTDAQDDDVDEEMPHLEPVAPSNEDHVPASDAETASTGSDEHENGWDVVSREPHSPIFGVETDDEMEAYFGGWQQQLQLIHGIMPNADTAICIDLLEKHHGNLEAVLLELTDL
ncbi:hypothetical protein Poli38472_012958 [Pythium oligandrum]|uniref:PB1 domain-containing protein n=1 Tax=Pythium oligandrum TaxID=41045 RepID=A0A8K1FIY5_PYTOL|nr:hypothetical protein Poli38472_012958 [Pythium oligandrum]|eukprot:TMW64336.1 hypothetical protein Poli38472_012958 [Pythium oligandrum]